MIIIVRYLFLKKNLYYISCVGDNDFINDYNCVDAYGHYYDDYCDDYDDDFVDDYNADYDDVDYDNVDYDDYDDYGDELVYYNKDLNNCKRLVSVKINNIVNLIHKDNYRHNITLLVDNFKILICENDN